MKNRIHYTYTWYETLKDTIAPLPQDSEIRVFLEDYMSIIIEKIHRDVGFSGYKFCPTCGHPLNPEDNKCYNSNCEDYDSLNKNIKK